MAVRTKVIVLTVALFGLAACRDTFDEWRKQVYCLTGPCKYTVC